MSPAEIDPDLEPGLRADARAVAAAWLRIGIGAAVAGQAMVFSLAVNLTPAEGAAYWLVHGGLLASALGVLFFLGRDLLGGAWAALRARRVTIDLLFLLTLLGALGGSLLSTFTGTGSVYYEVVAVLVVVHTLGKLAGARSRAAALRAADAEAGKYDRCAVSGVDGREEIRLVTQLRGGERVAVAAGGSICVDGVIHEGCAYVEEAALTGEWRPVARGPGDRVWAGSRALDGRLVVVAEAGPRRLDGVLRAVAEARLAPSRFQARADRLMAWWLPVVAGASVATFLGWWLGAGVPWARALFNAMAVLLVACPCAMGLATPVAVWGGLARLARLGIVARSADFLEALAEVDWVCFDKTGTLSEEALVVRRWEFEPAWVGRAMELKAAVAAVERGLEHPLARALAVAGAERGQEAEERHFEPGAGVEGVVAGVGRVRVGERTFADGEVHVPVDGKCVWVAVDGVPAARAILDERWREGLAETVAGLRALGLELEVLTGDAQAPGEVGGVPVRAGLTPEEKRARVAVLSAEGRRVLFAGDGVNDAAAMGVAAGALALRGGSALARAAAMAVCAGDDLRRLPEAVRGARRVAAGVRANLRFAAGYNLAGMALAASGCLHPVVAALLMVGSSVWVGARAVRSAEAAETRFRSSIKGQSRAA